MEANLATETEAAAVPAEQATAHDLENGSDITVRFQVRKQVIDPSVLPKMAQNILEGQSNRFRRKYAHVVGPDGQRPTIVLDKPTVMGVKINVILEYPEEMAGSIEGHGRAKRVA